VTTDDAVARPETLVVEKPLEIRVNGTPVTVTMRTPGSDIELAQGFLLTEGGHWPPRRRAHRAVLQGSQ
jgi:FdhD protein